MLLNADVQDDLIEKLPEYYSYLKIDESGEDVLVYQNGKDNPRYAVFVQVYPL